MNRTKQTGGNAASQSANLWRGQLAEDLALKYLQHNGLLLLTRNYRCRGGEIDLVMQHADQLVFIEVRYRRKKDYGTAAETITAAKIRRLRSTAAIFLQHHEPYDDCPIRFDVVALSGPVHAPVIEWIRDAF